MKYLTLAITLVSISISTALTGCKSSTKSASQQSELREKHSDADVHARVETYLHNVGSEVRAAIAAGEMTPQEGRAKYNEAEARVKQRLGMHESADQDARRQTRMEYAEAKRSMQQMVDAGEITEEQMNQRLNRMRQRIQQSRDND